MSFVYMFVELEMFTHRVCVQEISVPAQRAEHHHTYRSSQPGEPRPSSLQE